MKQEKIKKSQARPRERLLWYMPLQGGKDQVKGTYADKLEVVKKLRRQAGSGGSIKGSSRKEVSNIITCMPVCIILQGCYPLYTFPTQRNGPNRTLESS